MIDLGPVGFNPVGEYVEGGVYQKLDVVTYRGSSYVAIQDTFGQLPTDTDYFKLVARGDTDAAEQALEKSTEALQKSNSTASQLTDLKIEVDAWDGSPLVASSTAGMTDTDRVYVNTSDGYWYYYDGDSWEQGGVYQSSGIADNSVNETMLKDGNVGSTKIKDSVVSANRFDKSTFEIGYYLSASGVVKTDSTNSFGLSDYIYVGSPTYIYLTQFTTTPGTTYVAEFNSSKTFIQQTNIAVTSLTVDSGKAYYQFTPQANTRYIRLSIQHKSQAVTNAFMLTLDSLPNSYEGYYWYINNSAYTKLTNLESTVNNNLFDSSSFSLPYIKGKKVMCNKVSNNGTAYYAGIECKDTITSLRCNYIWESGQSNSGTLALIINPNGVNKISNITDLSLHITFSNDHFNCDVFGRRFDDTQNLYQRLLQQYYDEPQSMDGETEHQIIISVSTGSNNVYISVDGVQYTCHFTPDSNISGLSDVIGKYGTFEHYCSGDRDTFNMPMVTYFDLRNSSNEKMCIDYFDRENGQLQNAPTGQPYHLINNGIYKN